MAKGWRSYPEYERKDFGDTVRVALRSVNRSANWLAQQSGINKGTISDILSGRRSCPPNQRRQITQTLGSVLKEHGRSADAAPLIRSAGLTADSMVGRATETTLGSSFEGTDAFLVHAEGLRFRHELGQIERAEQCFESASDAAAVNGRIRLETRALLNRAYLRFEVEDLSAASSLAERVAALARANSLWHIAAEAKQLQGRISLRQELHAAARRAFAESNALLVQLGDAGNDIAAMWPRNLPMVGHSFVVGPDVEIPASVIRGGTLHFLGKSDVLQLEHHEIPFGQERDRLLARGFKYLHKAYDLDSRSSADNHIGFDLVVQGRWRGEVGNSAGARRLLDESRQYFNRGAGWRNWCLTRAYVTASEGGKLSRALNDVERVTESAGWSASALGELYEGRRYLHWHYRPKSWKASALRYAFAAAVLQPYPSYLRRFDEALKALREGDGKRSSALHFVMGLRDELLAYGGDFVPISGVAPNLGAGGPLTLRNNVNAALERARI